ncbi:LLM class flavin-dependent oxidoreductase [Salinicoccus cyprini]|uniref:LLM class flavin-dependent oxidoreductase n=1 Tax=Salinicoccus cyprini TaxID=2493691 RepID=A0A558AU76_9STAP|nr:LLM class flavin-dependent oxidoreductase [Salinicoccus cyprini]TVT27824.1 LLM class flavin-dependent oxidoreductase [Salinicoccus cyprini]
MELGISTFAETLPDPHTGETISHAERLRDIIEEIELADQVGLDVYAVGEHHRADYAVSAPEVVLAAGAARTENIRLSSAVTVLSSDDPVRVHERFAMLDGISRGRAEIMAGRGSFIESFQLFGYSLNDYDALFEEKLDLLLKLQKGGPVQWNGNHRAPMNGLEVFPRPEQDQIPIWIASGGTPDSTVRAGKLGLPLALAIIGGSPQNFAPLVELYKQTAAQAGHKIETLGIASHSHGFVWDTDEEAADLFFPSTEQGMNRIGAERGWGNYTRRSFDIAKSPKGALYCGSPETVARKIIDLRKNVGIRRFLLHTPLGTMPHDQVMKSIRLFGEQVAPIVREEIARWEGK